MIHIKENQPVFYKIINNAVNQNKLSHAFLLCGDYSDIATNYLVLKLLCKFDEPCCQCDVCYKYLNNIHSDIIRFNGNEVSIKKQNIEFIINSFKKTPVEGEYKIYILENIDKASNSALNSILKFLEEPEKNTIAIFTTSNKQSILPTIISRCQCIDLLPISKKDCAQRLIDKGYELAVANIIAHIYGSKNVDDIDVDLFNYLYLQALNTVEDVYKDKGNLHINTYLNLCKTKRDRNDIKIFLSIIVMILKDLLNYNFQRQIIFADKENYYSMIHFNLTKVVKDIENVSMAQKKLEGNDDLLLIIDSLLSSL